MKEQRGGRKSSKKGRVVLEVSSCQFWETGSSRTDITRFFLLTERPVRGPAECIGSGGDQAKGGFAFGWYGARLTWDTGAGACRERLRWMQAARVDLRVAQREGTMGMRPVR